MDLTAIFVPLRIVELKHGQEKRNTSGNFFAAIERVARWFLSLVAVRGRRYTKYRNVSER